MIATPNMKLYLPFERNANDFSGNGNNGTVYGASLVDGGKFGKCYSFDGVDDYIAIPDSYDFHLTKFTVACWVYLDSSITCVFFSSINSEVTGNDRGILFRVVNGELNVFLGCGISRYNYYSGYNLDLETWTHVAATYDGSTLKMYANGELVYFVNTSVVPQYFTLGNNNVRIGALKYDRLSGLVNYFRGDIDDMAIFSKALTESDIKRIMLNLHPLNR